MNVHDEKSIDSKHSGFFACFEMDVELIEEINDIFI